MSDHPWLRRAATLRRLALAAIVTNVGIVLTGGTVRLTGSGLGCPDWPTCHGTRVVPGGAEGAGWHQAIEFGNRLLTFVVLAVAVAAYLSARRAAADRPDVIRLAAALPLGVLGQALLGGVTVLTDLNPLVVAAHFLLSMVLIGAAVALHHRVTGGRRGGASPATRRLAWTLLAVAAAVLVLGTLVTASGPHAGDPGTPRLGLDIRAVARTHAGTVWVAVALTLATLAVARRRAETAVARGAAVLLAVEVAQGTVGYTQYALGIPEGLVALHLLLACLFWVAALRVALAARRAPLVARPAPGQVADHVAVASRAGG